VFASVFSPEAEPVRSAIKRGEGWIVGHPVVHFEIIGRDPGALRRYYGDLFGWEFDTGDASTEAVSEPGNYGFVGESSAGINGGVGGGKDHEARVLFYVGVPDVEAALAAAEQFGGTRVMGPEGTPGNVVVGQFRDPQGNLIGVAGTE
jgi:predicted enzyme related to lactoylglutathione lyase